MKGEPGSTGVVELHAPGGDVRIGIPSEGDHAGAGPGPHPGDHTVVRVEYRGPVRAERLHQLALCGGDRVDAAEHTDVRDTDAEDNPDVGPNDPRQVTDVSETPGAVLEHKMLGVDAGAQRRQRQTNLAVVRR